LKNFIIGLKPNDSDLDLKPFLEFMNEIIIKPFEIDLNKIIDKA